MKKEQELAFEYGRTAFTSGCKCAPCYDERMHKLVRETRSKSGNQRTSENMRAWYLGFLTQQSSLGKGMNKAQFVWGTKILLPEGSQDAAQAWIAFAKDCVAHQQFVDFQEKGNLEDEVNRWLDSILAGLLEVKVIFGEKIAEQVFDLALKVHSLYPDAMPQVEDYFMNGGRPENIEKLMKSGVINNEPLHFPKLGDVCENYSPCTNEYWKILDI